MTPYLRMMIANKGKGEFRAEGSTIWLYDTIASDEDEAAWWGGVSPQAFIRALSATSGPVTLKINSPGGSVFGAQAIVAAMRGHNQPITARVDALAASAASVIAAEAAHLEMVQGSMLMIHKAWGLAVGNEDDFHKTAELLAKIDNQIADTYARRSESVRDGWLGMMRAETWFDAGEAVAAKLADSVVEENLQRPQAKWDLSAFTAAPWQPQVVVPAPKDEIAPAPVCDSAARARALAVRLVAAPF
jgi:ATP-dependent Clp protease, protease subunit